MVSSVQTFPGSQGRCLSTRLKKKHGSSLFLRFNTYLKSLGNSVLQSNSSLKTASSALAILFLLNTVTSHGFDL